MCRAIPLSLLLALVLSLPTPSAAQYMYLDANGDGVHSDADVVAATGTTDVDVWLVTNQNRGGSPANCSTQDGNLTINSYVVQLRASGGAVQWGAYENRMAEFSIPLGSRHDSTDLYIGAAGANILPPGRYKLATVHLAVESGDPRIDFIPTSPLSYDPTSFGSACSGLDYDNTQKLGSDWFDADGLGSSVSEGHPPVIEHIADVTLDENAVGEARVVATDPDGDSLRITLRGPGFVTMTGVASSPGRIEADLSFAPTFSDAGVHMLRVDISDGLHHTGQTSYVTVRNVNRPPVFLDIPDVSVEVGTVLDVAIRIVEPDGDRLTWRLDAAPTFASLVAPGLVRFGPGLGDEGASTVTVVISDGSGEVRRSFIATVTNSGQHGPPVFDPIPDVWMDEGTTSVSYVAARDPAGGSVTLRLLQAPRYVGWYGYGEPWEGNGRLGISPGPKDSGAAVVRLEASTSLYSATTEFTVHVRDRAFPPTLSEYEVCVEQGETRSHPFTAHGPDLDSLVLSTGPLPPWATFVEHRLTPTQDWSGALVMAPGVEEPPVSVPVIFYGNRGTPDEVRWTVTMNLAGMDECPTYGMPFESVVADAGGPYTGMAGVPVDLQGASSSSGWGEYRWTFGDGHAAVGANASHMYQEGGIYRAVFRVSRFWRDSAEVVIRDAYLARAVLYRNQEMVQLSRKEGFCLSIQRVDEDFELSELDPLSMSLWVSRGGRADSIFASVATTGNTSVAGSGAAEVPICFAQSDLRRLFEGSRGRLTVEARVQGRLSNGARVRAPVTLTVVGHAVGIGRVEVRPNPMNPTGIVAFETSRTGRVRIQIYDVAGRLVRSLWDGLMPGGPAEVLLDGRNDHGSALGSGVYYYRVETVDRVRTGRLTILK
jgi:hypothetical protein